MVPEMSVLVALVHLVDQFPMPRPPARRRRPAVYSERLFVKALVIMIVKHLPRVHTLVAVLEQPTPEMQQLPALLWEQGRYPPFRTNGRRRNEPPQIWRPRWRNALMPIWAVCR